MNADQQIAQDFAAAERVMWSAVTFWRAGDYVALTALLQSLEPGERLALELRMINTLNSAMGAALGDDASDYVAAALYKAHAEGAS